MIFYIASYSYADDISVSVAESGKSVLDKKVVMQFDLALFMKQQMEQMQQVDVLIIDLSALNNADEDIIKALSSFRMLNDSARIIIISPENRTRGDRLLSDIFCLGIYNIIVVSEDKEQLKDEIVQCITRGKTYRESLIYKENFKVVDNNSPSPVKERVIIKHEIRHTVNKALIGFIGTQSRIGVTHNAIVSANFLKSKGFKIALIEDATNTNKCFNKIREAFDIIDSEEFFTLNQIDYYSNYDLTNIYKILTKNYNFVLIDFGIFDKSIVAEFNRCVIPIVIAGTKPWEVDYMNNLFESVPENELKEYTYLFNFTDKKDQIIVKEGMEVLKNIYFSECIDDPFNPTFYPELENIFKGYIPETITKVSKQANPSIKERIDKIKCKLKISK